VLSSDFEISCDPARVDVALVHEFLSASYWAQGRSREIVERSIRNSLCFGVYTAGRQVAFARVVTDRAVFAHEDLQTLRSFHLGTRDAHRLYAQFGFEPVREPQRLMGWYAPSG